MNKRTGMSTHFTLREKPRDTSQVGTIAPSRVMQPALEALAELEGEFPELAQNARYSLKTVGAKYAARLVKAMRQAAGVTQGQLASQLGQTQSMISDIERGRGQFGPSHGQLIAIADALGMEITFKKKGDVRESSVEERC